MDDGVKTALLIGVPLAIGAGVLIATAMAGKEQGGPVTPPVAPVCAEGSTQTQVCQDGTQVITHQCFNGQWQPTGNECPPIDLIQKGTTEYAECYIDAGDGNLYMLYYNQLQQGIRRHHLEPKASSKTELWYVWQHGNITQSQYERGLIQLTNLGIP